MSHRSQEFLAILQDAKQRLRQLLRIPDNYHVLFLQGGSRLQFSMVPMNLLVAGHRSEYVITGSWGKKAYEEAVREGETRPEERRSGRRHRGACARRSIGAQPR
jgi:phosphoserine aminotransferase